MRYKHILLDLDNTLYDTRQTERLAFMSLMREYNISEDIEEHFAKYRQINMEMWMALERGEVKAEALNGERFRRLFEYLSIDADTAETGIHYLDLLCENHRFYDGAEDLYNYLIAGYNVALVTNGLRAAQEKRVTGTFLDIQASPLFIGELMGVHKPAAEVVDYIMKAMNWENKGEMIIIGDSLSSDIQCAQNAGIASIWCNFIKQTANGYAPDYEVTDLVQIKEIL